METASFGGGCFWGVEAAFREVKGVIETSVGYMGGTLEKPTYKDVCTKETGHAETVQVKFDPKKISYEKILEVFWNCHDASQLNRQGPDVGTQYRSVIFYQNAKQKTAAISSMKKLQQTAKYKNTEIVTEIVKAGVFNLAEEYHQRYLEKRGLATCHI